MKKFSALIPVFLLIISCATPESSIKDGSPSINVQVNSSIQPGKWLKNIKINTEYEGQKSITKIQIFFPRNYVSGEKIRTIIALHSYGSSEKEYETSSSIESYANKYTFAIVCPSMGKTVYENSFYPETSYKWNAIPGAKFAGEVLINFLNKNYGLALTKSSTGIMGLTVGAYGALTVAAKYNNRFGAAAGISGFYDPATIQNDRIIEAVYGSSKNHRDRWEKEASVIALAEKLSGVPVFLYHGTGGDVYNPGQSRMLAIRIKSLQKSSSSYSVTYRESKSGYQGWLYWKRQIPEVLEFMDQHLKI
jgi:S-formylglutathione hydrolase FrmB